MSHRISYNTAASAQPIPASKKPACHGFPFISAVLLGLIVLLCMGAEFIMTKDPSYMHLDSIHQPPCGEFIFGTDSMGRDIFSALWYGGRISVLTGILSALISALIAVLYGSFAGVAPCGVDTVMMRFAEIMISIPSLLAVLFLQAILGRANVLSLSFVIGVTSWPAIAKVVCSEVRRLRNSEYVIASRCMGGGFFHILKTHFLPNLLPSVMFMVVMNVRGAIVAESTLSFLGLGMPLEVITWGSMLSLAEKSLMASGWWAIVIPGVFLITLLMCITNISNWLRKSLSAGEKNV